MRDLVQRSELVRRGSRRATRLTRCTLLVRALHFFVHDLDAAQSRMAAQRPCTAELQGGGRVSAVMPLDASAPEADQTTAPVRSWPARLELGFEPRVQRTALAHRRHHGPLRVQRPFYPEGDVCHCYLLHPPGGLVGGDMLEIDVYLRPGANALVTTPGATKFYRQNGFRAGQSQQLDVAANAVLEWMPQESIYFDGCDAASVTRIDLERDARFIGWEITVLGRPASGDWFRSGIAEQRIELYRERTPLYLDRLRLTGDSGLLTASAGLSGHTVSATMLATGVDRDLLETLRASLPDDLPGQLGMTLKHDLLIARFIGDRAEHARQCFVAIWRVLRPALIGREACVPRIWNT